jgi:hypothetical protein
MKSIEQHPADLLDGIGPLEPVDADVLVTLCEVLAAEVVSLVDLPVFDSSAISDTLLRDQGPSRLRASGASMNSNDHPYPLGFGRSCLAPDLSVGTL